MLKKLICPTIASVFLQGGEVLSIEQTGFVPGGSLFSSIGRMLLALGITLAALLLISYLAKRFHLTGMGPMAPGYPIKILATKYLGGRKSIWVVEIEGERLVLGLSSEGLSFLTKLRGPEGAI